MNDYCQIKEGLVVGVLHTTEDFTSEDFVICSGADKSWVGTKSYDGNAFHEYSPPVRVLSRLEFIERFTDVEFAGILMAAKSDVQVEAYWVRAQNVTEVSLDHPTTSAGLDLLVSKGLITAERKTEILA